MEANVDLIRELTPEERPRERLLRLGAQALSDAELVAVLLRTGRRGASAMVLARELLREKGGLRGLLVAQPAALKRRGLGPAKASSVLAALEIGRRLARSQLPSRAPMSRPDQVATYLGLRYAGSGQEVMGAVFLDSRNRLLGERELFRGTLSRAAVEPRPILKEGLLLDASGVVLFHTHPSGDPSPSAEDLLFTQHFAEAGALVGVRLVDHLVLARGGRWASLRERGAW